MRTSFIAAICASTVACLVQLPARAEQSLPRIVHTQFSTSDYVIATAVANRAPFSAPSDGRHDATLSIQKAIDHVASLGGGVVFLPTGRYRCDGDIVLREGVTLRGDWSTPENASGRCKVAGTILMPTGGRGRINDPPFVAMQRGSGIRDLSIWYPEQDVNNIVAYPWTIATDPRHTGNNFTVEQVTLVNPYLGMKFGPEFNEMFTVRQVYGTPLHIGLTADSVTDIGRIINVRLGPTYWSASGLTNAPAISNISKYLRANAIGIDIQRSDWQYIYDLGIKDYALGIHFRKGVDGATLGVLYDTNISGCQTALNVDEVATGLAFTRCIFEGDQAGLVASSLFAEDLQFNDCTLQSKRGHAAELDGSGSVRFQNCVLSSPASAVAVKIDKGSLTLLSCTLAGAGTRISLAKDASRAIVSSCSFTAGNLKPVMNLCHGAVQIDNRNVEGTLNSYPAVTLPPDRRPATDKLFNVIDYGARPASTTGSKFPGLGSMSDNTAAFRKALKHAGASGGGTVYVPAGYYLLKGNLVIPTGVELRGCFDVPHHTISLGSVLLPTAGRGDDHGTPFILLKPNSGARGLTVWYPGQLADDITPFPWTVRALGHNCWLIDFTAANPYRLADFGTYPCGGHLLRYVAGSPIREGIWVSREAGVVDSCHFNAHEWVRAATQAPPLTQQAGFNAGDALIDYQQRHLDAFVFGDCGKELQVNNFVYGCAHGLTLSISQTGGCGGWVINHASDGSSTGVRIAGASPNGCTIINTQIATVGKYKYRAIEEDRTCTGRVNFIGGISFGETDVPTMSLLGSGQTLVQGWLSMQMAAEVGYGTAALQDCLIPQPLASTVQVIAPIHHLELVANSAGPNEFICSTATHVAMIDNGKAEPIQQLADRFAWPTNASFAPDPEAVPHNQYISNLTCQENLTGGPKGVPTLEISGQPDADSHTIGYFKVFSTDIAVKPETVFRYWIKPENKPGQHTGVDLIFNDGTALRDQPVSDIYGKTMHPVSPRGVVGAWSRIECPIGTVLAGKTITAIEFAYDNDNSSAPFKSEATNIEIGEPTE
jgi:hypothetical protein